VPDVEEVGPAQHRWLQHGATGWRLFSVAKWAIAAGLDYSAPERRLDGISIARPASATHRSSRSDWIGHCAARGPLLTASEATHQLRCYSHPLGRGCFFYLVSGRYLYASTRLADLTPLLDRFAPNRGAIANYFLAGTRALPGDGESLIEGISRVPPGWVLTWERDHFTCAGYWDAADESDPEQLSMAVAAHRLADALEETVAALIATRRHVAVLASGGVDSSTVAAFAAKPGVKLTLLTLGGDLASPEEHRLQGELAGLLRAELAVVELDPPGFQLEPLRLLNRTSDEPVGGLFTAAYSEALAQASVRDVELVLTGEGGDELFSFGVEILPDLLRRRRFAAALRAMAFLASLEEDASAQKVLLRAFRPSRPQAPFASAHRWRPPWILGDASDGSPWERLLREFMGFLTGQASRLRARVSTPIMQGLSPVAQMNVSQAAQIPLYEAGWPNARPGLPVASPLTDLRVVRAALSIAPEARTEPLVGFMPKQLLRLAALTRLSPRLAMTPKIGVANLVARMTMGLEDDLVRLLGVGLEEELGFSAPDPTALDPRGVPTARSFPWVLLLVLVIWLTEQRQSFNDGRCLLQ
jgi:asparagine synthetase B (glutamine-hydrolysing)